MSKSMRILLPTDFSETAQNAYVFALSLTQALDGDLELLHVVYPEYANMDLPVVSTKDTRVKVELARAAIEAFVDLGRARIQLEDEKAHLPEVRTEVEVGMPPATIMRVAGRDNIGLIVMGTRGEHSLLEKTFGSVTSGVLAKTNLPVLIIPEEARFNNFRSIAVATELRPEEFEPFIAILELLTPLDAEFRLVHVHDPKRGVAREEESLQRLQKLFSNYGKESPAVLKIGPENVIEALEDFTETYQTDMMVMLSYHRTLWERLFYRSKTRQMLFQSKVPLFIYPA